VVNIKLLSFDFVAWKTNISGRHADKPPTGKNLEGEAAAPTLCGLEWSGKVAPCPNLATASSSSLSL
jgi:hypothetical protein